MNNRELRKFIKQISGTQYEWKGSLDNLFRIFDKNISTYNPDNLLDIGCHDGDKTIQTANYFKIDMHNIYGVDSDDRRISTCKNIFNAHKIDLESEDLPYEENMFDLVVCNQVLEHLKNYRKVIDDMIRITRKKGYIVLGIPNLAHLINRIYLVFGIQPMCIHIDGPHVRGFTHKSFVDLLSSLDRAELIDFTGTTMYPLPSIIGNFLSKYLIGLSGYICYLLQKV